MKARFYSAITPPNDSNDNSEWYIFRRFGLLVKIVDGQAQLPNRDQLPALGISFLRQQFLGFLDNRPCFSAEVGEDSEAADGWTFANLRHLFGLLDEDHFWVAGAAVQIVDWDRTHQYCGRCAHPTHSMTTERAKKCNNCGLVSYPRISPAIIVLVEREDKILLARSKRHPLGLYSVLAGFVEPGETLEATVRREIKEEVGLKVRDIRYFGSQPWPFPNSLMIAFTCRHENGEIDIDDEEMADAGWYTPDNLPKIPPPISIARQLIDWYVNKHSTE